MYRVYVDEAGDRGMQPSSSDYFVVTAIVVKDQCDQPLRADLARIRAELGRRPGDVLHFRKMNHNSKVKVSRDLGGCANIATVISVIMCKRHLRDPTQFGGAAFISIPDPMYLYALHMLLERVSWFIRDHGDGSSIVTFAQIKGFPVSKINEYRARLEATDRRTHWPSFTGHQFTMRGTEERELLQLADSAASSTLAAIQPNRFGDTEDRYLRNLAPKLYRHRDRPLTMYGLKVFPPAVAQVGGLLAHLDRY